MSRPVRALLVVVAISIAGAALIARETRRRPDVILVLVDTLRADRLGAYGAAPGSTPFLDELAGRSHVFQNAMAASSWTNPSVASLFTSRYPSEHGAVAFGAPLRPDLETLAMALRTGSGHAPAAFLANPILTGGHGFERGFHTWSARLEPDNAPPRRRSVKDRAERLNRLALEWLDEPAPRAARPVFLYLHYFEPHAPYSPPAAALAWAAERRGRPAPDPARATEVMMASAVRDVTPAELADLDLVYDAEVHALDEDLRDLFASLEQRGRLANAVVIVTADHGEELHDHGRLGHGRSLYDEVLRVPLLISLPGQTRRVDVPAPVSLVDVAPTVTELARAPRPSSFGGSSLVPLFSPDTLPVRVRFRRALEPAAPGPGSAFAELLPAPPRQQAAPGPVKPPPVLDERRASERIHRRALVTEEAKALELADGSLQLLDRRRDPGELQPREVGADDPSRSVAALTSARTRLPFPAAAVTGHVDAPTRERLQALGYVD